MENVTKSVHVFFGGATKLKAERDLVNSVANELSSKYDKDGIHVVVSSFKTLGDNQEIYNDFLKDEADVAIFVIKGEFNEYTRSELNTALEEYRKESRPHLHVFQSLDLSDPKQAAVEEELSTILRPQHAVHYKDIEELRSLVRDRITDAIKKQMQRNQIQGARGRSLWGWAAALAIFLGSLVYWAIENNRQMPVFIGGGSVSNFIRETWGIDLNKYAHSVIISLPTGTAYTILGEEGNRDLENKKFVPVVLSADRVASEKVFTSVCGKLTDKLSIVEYWLGKDSLTVFVNKEGVDLLKEKKAINYSIDEKGHYFLNGTQLTHLLDSGINEESDFSIYITSVTSGTLGCYEKALGKEEIDKLNNNRKQNKDKVGDFHQNNAVSEGNRIFLGSKYFRPKDEITGDDSPYVKFLVAKPEGLTDCYGDFLYKEMYLYLPLYTDKHIPKCVIDFIKKNPLDKKEHWKELAQMNANNLISVLIRDNRPKQ